MSRVSIVRCPDYGQQRVADAISNAVSLLGGMGTFVKPGDTVLIKPNLLSPREPDEAVCTHPEVVRATVRFVKEVGGRPLIGDSPGNFFTVRDVDYVYEKTGMKSISKEEDVELVRFDKAKIIRGYPIAEVALNVSSIICLPKFKTHSFTVMTGAIKNMFGLIPGLFKVECHRNRPRPKDFVKILLDVFEIVKPRLSIMDGIVGMEGDGPAAGNTRRLGLILASHDAVSLDAVVSKLVGLSQTRDILIKEAKARGAGETQIEKIKILGEAIDDVRIKGFRLPKTAYKIDMLPDFLVTTISRIINFAPVIDKKLCKKCGVCKNSCPADAIVIDENRCYIDPRACARCFCCHEVCPHKAIYIKRNFIANLLWRDEEGDPSTLLGAGSGHK